MAKISLVIVESDRPYITSLTNFLSEGYGEKLQITCFTEIQYLEKYFQKNKKIDILLINPEMFFDEMPLQMINNIIILSGKKDLTEFKGYPIVNKYQTGEDLYNELLNICLTNDSGVEQISENPNKEVSITTVYSPIGGIGKTSIAIALALTLCKLSKAVLYLNLEDIQSTPAFFNCTCSRNLSDLLYFVKDRSDKFQEKLQSIVLKDVTSGLNYFGPVDSVLDIEDLNSEDTKFLMESLCKTTRYEYIIIDLSSRFNSNYNEILSKSSKVLIPIGQDKLSSVKLDNLLKQTDKLDNFYFLINKYREENDIILPQSLVSEKKPIIQNIYYDLNLEKNNVESSFMKDTNVFNRGIEELLRKII